MLADPFLKDEETRISLLRSFLLSRTYLTVHERKGTPLEEDVVEFLNIHPRRRADGNWISTKDAIRIIKTLPPATCDISCVARYLSSPVEIYRLIARHRLGS